MPAVSACCGTARRSRRRRDRVTPGRRARRGSRGSPRWCSRAAVRDLRRHRLVAELGEQLELDRRQHRLRGQEPHPHLHDVPRVQCRRRAVARRRDLVGDRHRLPLLDCARCDATRRTPDQPPSSGHPRRLSRTAWSRARRRLSVARMDQDSPCVCRVCGHASSVSARFCLRCGARLRIALTANQPASEPENPDEDE